MPGGIAVLCLVWGTTWSVIQVGLEGIPPFTGIAIRFTISGGLLLGVALARGIPLGKQPHERWLWWVNGAFGFAVSYGIVYWAEQWVPSGLTAVLWAVYPLVISLMAHLFLPKERLGRIDVLGVLLGFAGVGVIFSEDFAALGGKQVAVASAILLLSPVAAAVGSVCVKRWGGRIHPLSHASVPMLIAAGLLGVLALTFEREAPITWDRPTILALLYLSIVGSAITFSLYFWLLARLAVRRLALTAYVIPILAVGIGMLRGEPLTARILVGALCVVLGVALAARRG